MPINKADAIVLKCYDFRETSIITLFYTKQFGKISGLLKGIRLKPSKFSSCLDLFSYNEIIFYKKRNSTLHLVSQAELKDNFSGIRNNITKIAIGNVITELLQVVCPEEDINEEIFDLALVCLKELETSFDADKLALIFKIKLLSLCGFKPHFDSCVACGDRICGQSKFSIILGGLLCQRCFMKDFKARTIFRGTVATIQHIEKNDFRNNLSLGMNPQIKKELGFVLNSFLNFHLQKKLKSELVIDKLSNC